MAAASVNETGVPSGQSRPHHGMGGSFVMGVGVTQGGPLLQPSVARNLSELSLEMKLWRT